MRRLQQFLAAAALIATTSVVGCATTSTTSREWGSPSSDYAERTGTVETVREVVRRVRGNPAGGAVAGALIGGVLFGGRGPQTLFGAAAGAAAGAALSSGRSETRAYDVWVRFDDGARGVFTYRDYSPLRPGDRIAVTPDGPVRIGNGDSYGDAS